MQEEKSLDIPINKNVKFSIFPNCDEYSEGYYEAFLEGETINGSVMLEYPKPEMVKCVRVQLVGFISKNNTLNFQDILKYINIYENLNINNSTSHSNSNSNNNLNNNNNSNGNNSKNNNDNSISKYEGLKILVDQDHILWGDLGTRFIDCSKSFKNFYKINGNVSSMDEVYSTRLDLINSKFSSSFMSGKKVLPFYFRLKHKSNNTFIPLPSSYKIGNYKIEYFMCATIYKDWQDKKIMLIKKLRVYQQINIDSYMNMNPLKVEKTWNISNDNSKDLIEMKTSIPNNSFCHRKIIPITIDVNNLSLNKTIVGFIVGLYEYSSVKNNLKKINKYSLNLLLERFYESKIKPQSKNIRNQLLFPLIDGNCYIKKRIIREEEENHGGKNPKDNALQLIDVKIPIISATINERSRWPIIVQHKLRIVALTEEDMENYKRRKNKHDKTHVINTDNEINKKGANNDNDSEDQNEANNSLIQIMNKLHFFDQYYDSGNEENYNNTYSSSIPNNNEISSKNNKNNYNYNYSNSNYDNINFLMEDHYEEEERISNRLLIENRKYGEILGHLSNKYGYYIPHPMKELDFEFDIIIGTVTKTNRECGEELCLSKEFDDQFYNVILNSSKYRQKLFQNENSDKNRKSPKDDGRNKYGNGLRDHQKEDSLTATPTPKSLLYISNNSNELLLPEDILNKKNKKKNITYHPHSSKVSPIYEATLSCSITSSSQNQIKSDLLHDDQIPSFDDYSIYSNSYNYQNNTITVSKDSIYSNKDEYNNNNGSRRPSTTSITSSNSTTSRKSSTKDTLLPKSNNKTDKSLKSHPVTAKVSPIYEATLSSSLCQSPNQIQNKPNDFK